MARYEHGGNIYKNSIDLDFSANINCFGMPEKVCQAAILGVRESVHYPDPDCTELKRAICHLEENRGNRVTEQQIICGNGASDLIYRLVQALHPRRAAVFAPGFQEYEQALGSLPDMDIYKICLSRENDFLPTKQDISEIPEDVELVFLCNPGNPTGLLLPEEILESMLEKAEKENLFLVLDESFMDFVSDEKRKSVTDRIEAVTNLFVVKAFTKMYGMPGLRLGYGLSGNRELIRRMEENAQPWSVSLPAQKAGVAACFEEKFVKQTRRWLVKERQYVKERLEKMGIRVLPGEADFLMFSTKPGLEKALLKKGILIRSCSNFTGLAEGDYRIAIRKREENDVLLEQIQRWLFGEHTGVD